MVVVVDHHLIEVKIPAQVRPVDGNVIRDAVIDSTQMNFRGTAIGDS